MSILETKSQITECENIRQVYQDIDRKISRKTMIWQMSTPTGKRPRPESYRQPATFKEHCWQELKTHLYVKNKDWKVKYGGWRESAIGPAMITIWDDAWQWQAILVRRAMKSVRRQNALPKT